MPLQANRDMAEGLKHIIKQMDWYVALYPLLLREKWTNDFDFLRWGNVLKSRITTLYEKLLEYQMKCVCQCYHDHPVVVCIKVLLGRLNWKSELDGVKALETATISDIQTYNNQVGVEFLRSIKFSS